MSILSEITRISTALNLIKDTIVSLNGDISAVNSIDDISQAIETIPNLMWEDLD